MKARGVRLSSIQKEARAQFLEKVEKGEYRLRENRCLCGSSGGYVVAGHDRYGIDLITVLCSKCGLLRSDPYYTQETLSSFYAQEYRRLYSNEKKCSQTFFEDQNSIGTRVLDRINTEVKGRTVFEIGCGAGGILKVFQDAGAEVSGCDYDQDYLEFGRQQGLELLHGGISAMKRSTRADIVILNHVLEHVVEPGFFLKQIRAVMKEDALLYLSVPCIETIPEWYEYDLYTYLQNAHVFNYSCVTIVSLLKSTGFSLYKKVGLDSFIFKLDNNVLIKGPFYEINKAEFIRTLLRLFKYEIKYRFRQCIKKDPDKCTG